MNQPTEVLVACLIGAGGGIGVIVLLVIVRVFPRRPEQAEHVPSALASTGYRWCPIEQRTRAAFLHRDGSATCADPDCRAHIPDPAGDS